MKTMNHYLVYNMNASGLHQLSLCICVVIVLVLTSIGYSEIRLTWGTIDCGGGISTGGGYTLRGTIGQHDALSLTGGSRKLRGGYWVFARCGADIVGTDATVNVTDLLLLLATWGPCSNPCDADVNSDGSVNVTDLLAVLGAWGPCP